MTPAGQSPLPPRRRPAPEALPAPDATLDEIIRFVRSADPTGHFRALWGDDYASRARELWNRCVEAHKAGVPPPAPPEELMMCLDYDLALGPYLGVPEPNKLHFLRWLIEGIRMA